MVLAFALLAAPIVAQTAPPPTATVDALGLAPEKVSHLKAAVGSRDYVAAESILLKELEQDAHSARAAKLLAYAGSIYFLNQDYLNAAIAWKKSEAIAPLSADLQFSQAMAYVRIGHPDWALPVLGSLAAADGNNALYPYWSGRLQYDAHQYEAAIKLFEHAIELDPNMARAWDNLGLCRFYLNQNEFALKEFTRAIELETTEPHPSAWPYVNRAATLRFLGRTREAEHDLRQAVRLDPGLAEAHFQLGVILQHEDHAEAAMLEFKEAIRLNAKYAEPHLALAHIYRQMGHFAEAEEEVTAYNLLRRNTSENR